MNLGHILITGGAYLLIAGALADLGGRTLGPVDGGIGIGIGLLWLGLQPLGARIVRRFNRRMNQRYDDMLRVVNDNNETLQTPGVGLPTLIALENMGLVESLHKDGQRYWRMTAKGDAHLTGGAS